MNKLEQINEFIAQTESHLNWLRTDPLRRAVDSVWMFDNGLFVCVEPDGKPYIGGVTLAASSSKWGGLGNVRNGKGEAPHRIPRKAAYKKAIAEYEGLLKTFRDMAKMAEAE